MAGRSWGFAGVAALVAAALAYGVWDERPFPVALVRIVDWGAREIDVRGGAELTLRPAPGDDPPALVRRVVEQARAFGLDAEAAPGEAVVDVAGEPARIEAFVHGLGRFGMMIVDDGSAFMQTLAAEVDRDPRARELGVVVEPDAWTSETSDAAHQDFFLAAAEPMRIVRYLRERSVSPPPGRAIVFEHVTPRSRDAAGPTWRTYLVGSEAVLDGSALADAGVFWDPVTNRPEVLVTFNDAGARRFGEITGANVGRKMAMVMNERVVSAPVIQTAITGGKSNITMGGGDPRHVQRAAEDLVAELRGAMALGASSVASTKMVAPRVALAWIVVLRALLGLLAGGLVFGVVTLAGRRLPIEAVPARPAATPATDPIPRLAVTIAAVAALLFRELVPLPFVDRSAGPTPGLFALGLVPIVAGFIVVEIVALAVPRWRPLRHGARVELTLHGIAVGLGIALVSGYSLARVLQGAQVVGAGTGAALLVAATLVGGTVCMLVLAALVGRYGLGNGLALVVVADLASRIPLAADRLAGRSALVAQAALLGIVVLTAWALRRRVGGAVRLPSAGVVPLAYGFVTLVLAAFRVADPFPGNVGLWIVLVVVASIAFTWLFWVGRAGPRTLLVASLVSAAYLVAIGGLASLASQQAGWTATLVALATAEALDLVDAWRGAAPEPEGGHVRGLLHFFAPWA